MTTTSSSYDPNPDVQLADPVELNELLTTAVTDAHNRTCLIPCEQIQEAFKKYQMNPDHNRVLYYKSMPHEQLWLEAAQKLTAVIQVIIEFAKMVPGFMKLTQDDQIVLLKAGE